MSGVILKKSAGKSVPDALVDKLLAKFKQTIGAAVVEGGELKIIQSDEGADKDVFKLVCNDYMDSELFIYLGDKKPNALDMQPFVLLKDSQSKPILVAFLVGAFDKHVPKGGTNSAEWFAIESDLLSRIRDTFDLCGSDVAKLLERIKTNTLLEKDIRRLYDDWGTITLIANTGDHHTIETGTKTLDAEWGWVTDPLDYTEASQTHTTEASPKKFSLQNFRRAAAAAISPDKPVVAPPATVPATVPAGPPAATPPPATAPKATTTPAATQPATPKANPPPATVPATTPAAPKATPATSPKVVEQDGEVLIPKVELTDDEKYFTPDPAITSNKALQAVYRREAGFLPDNWKQRPRVEISNRKQKVKLRDKSTKVVKSFQDIGKVITPPATTAAAIPATTKMGGYPDMTAKHIPEEEIEVGILSTAQKKKLNDFISDAKVIKIIDKHAKVVANPADLQAFEEKRPSFTDITGLDLDDLIYWPPQVFKMMAEHDAAWAERAITQAIYERHCIKELLNKKEKADEKPPASVPAVPAKPAATPAMPAAKPAVGPPATRRQVA